MTRRGSATACWWLGGLGLLTLLLVVVALLVGAAPGRAVLLLLLVPIAAALAWGLLERILLRPLRHLRTALEALAVGRAVELPEPTRGPLGALTRSVHHLGTALAQRERELRAATAAAEDARRATAGFVTHLGHELRTPLNALLGYADLIRKTPVLDPETRERADIVHASGRRLVELLDTAVREARRVGPASHPPDGKAAARPAAPPVVGDGDTRRRVLLVDDEATSRLLLAHLLGELGCIVDLAESAEAALARASEAAPDLVVMDLIMPGTSGYAAALALRGALGRPDLPVIALSAPVLGTREEILGLGFDGCLLKPVARAPLRDALADGLSQAGQRVPATPAVALDMAAEPEPPPRDELDTIAELVRLGAWAQAADWCDDLATGQPELAPFAARVRAFIADRDAAGLLRWLE